MFLLENCSALAKLERDLGGDLCGEQPWSCRKSLVRFAAKGFGAMVVVWDFIIMIVGSQFRNRKELLVRIGMSGSS